MVYWLDCRLVSPQGYGCYKQYRKLRRIIDATPRSRRRLTYPIYCRIYQRVEKEYMRMYIHTVRSISKY